MYHSYTTQFILILIQLDSKHSTYNLLNNVNIKYKIKIIQLKLINLTKLKVS